MKQNRLHTFLVGCTTLFLLVACGGKNQPSKPDDPQVDNDPESILKDLDFKPTAPINLDKQAYYNSDHINDVEPTFTLKLGANPGIGKLKQDQVFSNVDSAQFREGIRIKSNKGQQVDFICNVDSEKNQCEIAPANGVFLRGLIYTCAIDNEDICFLDKNPVIRTIHFDVHRDDNYVYQLSKDLKYFDCSKVLREAPQDSTEIEDPNSEEAKNWFENTTYDLIYADDSFSKLKEGDNFAICPFKGGKPAMDDKNSYFCKFVKNEKIDGGYKVTYKNVDLHEIYKDENGNESLDVYFNERKVTEFRDVVSRFDEEEFKETLRNDLGYQRLIHAAIIATDRQNDVTTYDVLTHIQVIPTFSWSAPKYVFQLEAFVFFPINDAGTASIKIGLTYQYISEISAGASYELETFMGIPYWINVKGALTQTITNKVSVDIALMRSFTPEEQDTSDMKEMVKKAYDKLENDPAYFMMKTDDEYSTSGNERLVPICAINFPFASIFSFYVELDIHLVMDFRIMFEYNYVKTYTQRVLNYTTDDGVENTANTDSISAYAHSIELLGELSYQIGIQLRVGFCITGLEKLFGLGVYFEGGLYFDLKGMVGISWGSDDDVRFIGGVDIDIGLYGVIAGYVDILCCHPKYEFAKGKLPLIGYNKPYSIIGLMTPDTIDISEKVTPLETTNLLMTKIFRIEDMKVDIIPIKPDDEIEITVPLEGSKKIKPIDVQVDSPYIEIKDNNIVVADICPPVFTAHVTITANEGLTYLLDGEPLTKTVTINYRSKDAHDVSIKGISNVLSVEKGRTVRLPSLKSVEGWDEKMECSLEYDDSFGIKRGEFKYDATYYDFVCFTDGINNYYPDSQGVFHTDITLGGADLVLSPVVKKIIYHTASFYNGKGEVIKVSKVRENTDAIEPTMEEIMAGMEGYTFYGWDRDFTHLTEDINVYGIYYKVGA